MSDWNPSQYLRFAAERRAPFDDLAALVSPSTGGRAIDLGCGTGELTRELHERLGARATLGLDGSPAMLEEAAKHAGSGLTFELGDIADAGQRGAFDVVFSNAALQWLPDLVEATRAAAALVGPGGQLAVQVPQNFDHASHLVAAEVAAEAPFAARLAGYARRTALTPPEVIASLLFELGFTKQRVRVEVYAHVLTESREVVEWVKGTLLTDYEKRLDAPTYAAFLARYEARLLERIGARAPYLYPFKRLLFWARR
ncbi:MAG TPA: methyltransferase domain-containing protein [Byssovorax sp.]|jgi:trans-aconitate 2-methyltransferase